MKDHNGGAEAKQKYKEKQEEIKKIEEEMSHAELMKKRQSEHE